MSEVSSRRAMPGRTMKNGVIKRRENRIIGVFVDGIGLDRATRRLDKKIDINNLVGGITGGTKPVVTRYYTIVPYEDDSRHRSYIDAVQRAGISVFVKRLPPKGVGRQVSADVEMASDIIAFCHGLTEFSANPENQTNSFNRSALKATPSQLDVSLAAIDSDPDSPKNEQAGVKQKRIVIVVCPSRDLAYPITIANQLGVETFTADFSEFAQGNVLKSSSNLIDLSDSETIWRS